MSGDDDSRENGVDLRGLDEKLDDHAYPASVEELLDEYGNHEISHPNGTETLRDVLEPAAQGDTDFDSAEEVERTVLNFVGGEAVGRQEYSDRGSSPDQDDQQSL